MWARSFCKSPHRAAQTAHGFAAWTADSRCRTKPCWSSKSMGSFDHSDKAQTAHDQLVTALADCTSTGEQTDITQAVHTSKALWLVAVHTGRTDWGKVVLQVSTPSGTNSSWICCVDRGLSVQNKALRTSMQGPPRAWDPSANSTMHKLHMTNWLPCCALHVHRRANRHHTRGAHEQGPLAPWPAMACKTANLQIDKVLGAVCSTADTVQLASTSTVLSACSPKAARRVQDILCFMATGRSAGHVHIARPSLQRSHARSRRYGQA